MLTIINRKNKKKLVKLLEKYIDEHGYISNGSYEINWVYNTDYHFELGDAESGYFSFNMHSLGLLFLEMCGSKKYKDKYFMITHGIEKNSFCMTILSNTDSIVEIETIEPDDQGPILWITLSDKISGKIERVISMYDESNKLLSLIEKEGRFDLLLSLSV
jgi:hypothetical protein